MQELDLAPPGPGEVLVRLGASGVCRSDYNAIDGTTESPCPVVLGHEGAGVVEAVGAGVTRVAPGDHVALSWTPSCGECAECVRDLPQLCATIWPVMGDAGLMDGTSRLSRDGERVYHYCFLSTFAEACVVPERSCVRIPRDVPFDVAALVGCAVTTGVGAVWQHRRRPAGRPRRRDRLRRRRPLRADGSGGGRRRAGDRRRHDAGKLDAAQAFGASAGVVWAGSAEATAEAVREASGGGVDYAIEATGHGRGDAGRRPLDAQSRRRGADRDPSRGRRC